MIATNEALDVLRHGWLDAASSLAADVPEVAELLNARLEMAISSGRLDERHLLEAIEDVEKVTGRPGEVSGSALARRLRRTVYEYLLALDAVRVVETSPVFIAARRASAGPMVGAEEIAALVHASAGLLDGFADDHGADATAPELGDDPESLLDDLTTAEPHGPRRRFGLRLRHRRPYDLWEGLSLEEAAASAGDEIEASADGADDDPGTPGEQDKSPAPGGDPDASFATESADPDSGDPAVADSRTDDVQTVAEQSQPVDSAAPEDVAAAVPQGEDVATVVDAVSSDDAGTGPQSGDSTPVADIPDPPDGAPAAVEPAEDVAPEADVEPDETAPPPVTPEDIQPPADPPATPEDVAVSPPLFSLVESEASASSEDNTDQGSPSDASEHSVELSGSPSAPVESPATVAQDEASPESDANEPHAAQPFVAPRAGFHIVDDDDAADRRDVDETPMHIPPFGGDDAQAKEAQDTASDDIAEVATGTPDPASGTDEPPSATDQPPPTFPAPEDTEFFPWDAHAAAAPPADEPGAAGHEPGPAPAPLGAPAADTTPPPPPLVPAQTTQFSALDDRAAAATAWTTRADAVTPEAEEEDANRGWRVRDTRPGARHRSAASMATAPDAEDDPFGINPKLAELRRRIEDRLRRKRCDEAAALLQALAQETGGRAVADLAMNAGDRCRTLGKSNAALNCYLAASRSDPVYELPLGRLADVCLDAQETDLAVTYLERIARLYRFRGDEKEALRVYRRIAAVAPYREDVLAILLNAQRSGRLD